MNFGRRGGSRPAHDAQPTRGELDPANFCVGEPRIVNSTHSGNMELSVSVQEPVLFLPSRPRHRSSHANQSQDPATQYETQTATSVNRDSDDTLVPPSYPQHTEGTPPLDSFGNTVLVESAAGGDNTYGEPASDETQPGATLRGSVLLKLQKPTRIKEVSLSFYCVSRTTWNLVPQPTVLVDSPLPSSAEVEDIAYLGIHHWDFVPLEQFGGAASSFDKNVDQSASLIGQDLYGADSAIFASDPKHAHHREFTRTFYNSACRLRGSGTRQFPVFSPLVNQPRKLRHQAVGSESIVFPPGSYIYHFALLIDSRTPETARAPNGYVKFFLAPRVVRSGPFAPNLMGKSEVEIVRTPLENTEVIGPTNILLSRVWDDRLVYNLTVDQRYVTLGIPTQASIKLLAIPGSEVQVHQVKMHVVEIVNYLYSLDSRIRFSDTSLRLLMYHVEGHNYGEHTGNILHPTEPTELEAEILLSTNSDQPIDVVPQAYGRGRFGEKRYIEPDVKGPYLRVKHRLVVSLRVSKPMDDGTRGHFEVKIDTPIGVLSKHCYHENLSLPLYTAEFDETEVDSGQPPSFDESQNHPLLGPPTTIVTSAPGEKQEHVPGHE